jgi:putative FmdB family regulatory protein
MPIYEYVCKSCKHKFEALVRGGNTPSCMTCGSQDLERLVSLPRIKSETTNALARKAAQQRDKAQATERVQEQIRYEQSHDA